MSPFLTPVSLCLFDKNLKGERVAIREKLVEVAGSQGHGQLSADKAWLNSLEMSHTYLAQDDPHRGVSLDGQPDGLQRPKGGVDLTICDALGEGAWWGEHMGDMGRVATSHFWCACLFFLKHSTGRKQTAVGPCRLH